MLSKEVFPRFSRWLNYDHTALPAAIQREGGTGIDLYQVTSRMTTEIEIVDDFP